MMLPSIKQANRVLAFAAISALGMMSTVGQAATYELDPKHTAVRFFVDHFGTSTNAGGFYNLSGILEYAPKEQKGFIGITIPMGSLSTGLKEFDGHLKSADFFNVKEHPTAYFKSTNWQFDGNNVKSVTGDLTLLGQTHPVTLTATKFNCYDSPLLNAEACGGDFETTIDRTKWGLNTYTDGGMMKNIKLVVQVEGSKKADLK
ncbi:YceI family protein [Psychrobacter sp. Rd 27.2]|uniref:YceI family protein n=1 Tax=Psychrobacter sp. Rd 27.2 TaxID=1926479 RepID=UPI000946FB0C|nr:YceI family protein [Psychrobacter sp. Rd 27.2]OLF41757.1 polyisoprenoid-binding protein [Psychrobacter sp. Rd 27.2]